ncbi:cation:proton antiporter [Candidatus Peribacteria bacterium]|nr:cation:proton antiporter [Candidatus Peribacteria bacterium]
MTDALSLSLILFLAFTGGSLGKRFGYPRVIGQLIICLLFGIPIIRNLVLTDATESIVHTMSQFGVILLLFLTGFEIDIQQMRKSAGAAIAIAFFAAIVPFGVGIVVGRLLGYSTTTSLILGMCLSVTAEGTKAALLTEMKMIKTRVGSIMLEAGILDDIFEVLFLTTVLFLSETTATESSATFPLRIAAFIVIIFLAFRFVPRLIGLIEKTHDGVGLFSGTIGIGMIIAIASEAAGLGSILGAFIAGLLMQKSFLNQDDRMQEEQFLHILAFALVIPFFFAYIGLHMQFDAIIETPITTLIILVAAIFGKIGGTLIAFPFTNLRFKQLLLIGWGMNSRGVMELVIAQIAFAHNLISQELYSIIVFVAVTTTVIFPFVIRHMVKQDEKIMN